MKYDIFISYSRKDLILANRICAAFERAGISYFIDREGIQTGMEFPTTLANAILDSSKFLFLASRNSYGSPFTNNEIVFAFNKKGKGNILPYIIDDSTLPIELEFTFASIQWRNIKDHPIETVFVPELMYLLGKREIQPGGGQAFLTVRTDRNVCPPNHIPNRAGLSALTFEISGRFSAKLKACEKTVAGAIDIPYNIKSGDKPYAVTSIEYRAFAYCSGLSSITIPSAVTQIGDSAFCWCDNLFAVTIDNATCRIGDSAFFACRALHSVNLGSSITSLGKYCFKDCRNLSSIIIPKSVTVIEEEAFGDCGNLTSVTILNPNCKIAANAFKGCNPNLQIIRR